MSKLYVTEYASIVPQQLGSVIPICDSPPLATQVLDFSGGHAESSAFNAKTRMIRLSPDAICSYLVSSGGTAAGTSDSRLAAGAVEYLGVPIGQSFKISAIANT